MISLLQSRTIHRWQGNCKLCESEDYVLMEKRDSFFERFFGISQSGSTMKIEIFSGNNNIYYNRLYSYPESADPG